MRALVEALTRESPAFAQFWREQSVLVREGGTRKFAHPLDGVVGYEQVTLVPAAHAGWKVVMLLGTG
jgi:MmyB-like transcription regulator ligand binding domain